MADELNLDDFLDFGGEELVDKVRTKWEKAPFGMPGAKFRSLKNLLPLLPQGKVWCDHFGGTGVVSWNRRDSELNVFNDRYSAIVDFYRCLQDKEKCNALIQYLNTMHPLSREEFLHSKMVWVDTKDPVERAARWYYMIRCSVIGKGHSFARATSTPAPIKIPKSLTYFEPIHWKLQNFQLENLDARVCALDYDGYETVHYFDPPYIGTDSGVYVHKWTKDDLKDLLRVIRNLKGFVALSHYPEPIIDECEFWTQRFQWDVNVTSEVQAYHDENYRKDRDNVMEIDYTTEVVWIKDV